MITEARERLDQIERQLNAYNQGFVSYDRAHVIALQHERRDILKGDWKEPPKPAQGHTPGPWRVSEGNMSPKGDVTIDVYAGEIFVCGIEGHTKEEMQCKGYFSPGVMEANARLIAAAPDLLAACKYVEQWFAEWNVEVGPAEQELFRLMQAAIAKAEGRAG